jgi:hypothetical protein
MNVLHDSSPDNSMQIGFHKVEDKVNIFGALGLNNIEKTDDVGVAVKLLQEDDLG